RREGPAPADAKREELTKDGAGYLDRARVVVDPPVTNAATRDGPFTQVEPVVQLRQAAGKGHTNHHVAPWIGNVVGVGSVLNHIHGRQGHGAAQIGDTGGDLRAALPDPRCWLCRWPNEVDGGIARDGS